MNKCFAISNVADFRTDNTAFAFKPYNLFTIKIDSDKKITEQPNPNDEDYTKYIDGYCTKLLNAFGKDPSEILNNAFEYANYAVQNLGWASGIKEYIYDGSNLVNIDENNALSNLNGSEIFEDSIDEDDAESIDAEHNINSNVNGIANVPLSNDEKNVGNTTSNTTGATSNTSAPMSTADRIRQKYNIGEKKETDIPRSNKIQDYANIIISRLEKEYNYKLNKAQRNKIMPLVIQFIKEILL